MTRFRADAEHAQRVDGTLKKQSDVFSFKSYGPKLIAEGEQVIDVFRVKFSGGNDISESASGALSDAPGVLQRHDRTGFSGGTSLGQIQGFAHIGWDRAAPQSLPSDVQKRVGNQVPHGHFLFANGALSEIEFQAHVANERAFVLGAGVVSEATGKNQRQNHDEGTTPS